MKLAQKYGLLGLTITLILMAVFLLHLSRRYVPEFAMIGVLVILFILVHIAKAAGMVGRLQNLFPGLVEHHHVQKFFPFKTEANQAAFDSKRKNHLRIGAIVVGIIILVGLHAFAGAWIYRFLLELVKVR
jgi:hypothetical protein